MSSPTYGTRNAPITYGTRNGESAVKEQLVDACGGGTGKGNGPETPRCALDPPTSPTSRCALDPPNSPTSRCALDPPTTPKLAALGANKTLLREPASPDGMASFPHTECCIDQSTDAGGLPDQQATGTRGLPGQQSTDRRGLPDQQGTGARVLPGQQGMPTHRRTWDDATPDQDGSWKRRLLFRRAVKANGIPVACAPYHTVAVAVRPYYMLHARSIIPWPLEPVDLNFYYFLTTFPLI